MALLEDNQQQQQQASSIDNTEIGNNTAESQQGQSQNIQMPNEQIIEPTHSIEINHPVIQEYDISAFLGVSENELEISANLKRKFNKIFNKSTNIKHRTKIIKVPYNMYNNINRVDQLFKDKARDIINSVIINTKKKKLLKQQSTALASCLYN